MPPSFNAPKMMLVKPEKTTSSELKTTRGVNVKQKNFYGKSLSWKEILNETGLNKKRKDPSKRNLKPKSRLNRSEKCKNSSKRENKLYNK